MIWIKCLGTDLILNGTIFSPALNQPVEPYGFSKMLNTQTGLPALYKNFIISICWHMTSQKNHPVQVNKT